MARGKTAHPRLFPGTAISVRLRLAQAGPRSALILQRRQCSGSRLSCRCTAPAEAPACLAFLMDRVTAVMVAFIVEIVMVVPVSTVHMAVGDFLLSGRADISHIEFKTQSHAG